MSHLPAISSADAAELILALAPGSLCALVGSQDALHAALDELDPQTTRRRALFLRFAAARSPEAVVAQTLDLLAATLLQLWPAWCGEADFSACRNDARGRERAAAIAKAAAERHGLSPAWAATAVNHALAGLPPRDRKLAPAVELAQLARTISPEGLCLIAEMDGGGATTNVQTVLHGLDWIARHFGGGVVALFAQTPADDAPYDRFLHGARRILDEAPTGFEQERQDADSRGEAGVDWIAPWSGAPHPLSDTERRVADAIANDAELAPLFTFNQTIRTIRGAKPRVDLLCAERGLVVELDGFKDHGKFQAFCGDRHRDYDLMLSGYLVLRLTNHEIAIDLAKAIEKIRDLARLRRA